MKRFVIAIVFCLLTLCPAAGIDIYSLSRSKVMNVISQLGIDKDARFVAYKYGVTYIIIVENLPESRYDVYYIHRELDRQTHTYVARTDKSILPIDREDVSKLLTIADKSVPTNVSPSKNALFSYYYLSYNPATGNRFELNQIWIPPHTMFFENEFPVKVFHEIIESYSDAADERRNGSNDNVILLAGIM